jgi:hypothetical protein
MENKVEFTYNEKNYTLYDTGELYGEMLGHNWKSAKWVKLNGSINYKSGYVSVQIGHFAKGKKKVEYLHRLVAKYFIPNPENKPCVNHIDGNKKNNKASNLEWATYSENHRHAYSVLNRTTTSGNNYGGGVYYRNDRSYWVANSFFNSRRKYLGSFKTEQEARDAVNTYNELIGKEPVNEK